LKAVSGKQMCRILERHGWSLDRIKSSHHIYKKIGHAAAISVPVHGNKTLKTGLQRGLMKQAGLSEDDL
jgi:predicted RNA binding protein YcfA (HicA-like mRNA interferase family)